MQLTCLEVLNRIEANMPALPAGQRLAKALEISTLDPHTTLVAIAYKESRFKPNNVNSKAQATGLYQFLASTADDVQDRVVKKFLAAGTQIPKVPMAQRFKDH